MHIHSPQGLMISALTLARTEKRTMTMLSMLMLTPLLLLLLLILMLLSDWTGTLFYWRWQGSIPINICYQMLWSDVYLWMVTWLQQLLLGDNFQWYENWGWYQWLNMSTGHQTGNVWRTRGWDQAPTHTHPPHTTHWLWPTTHHTLHDSTTTTKHLWCDFTTWTYWSSPYQRSVG